MDHKKKERMMWLGAWAIIAIVFFTWLYMMPKTLEKGEASDRASDGNGRIGEAVESAKNFFGDMQKKWEELNGRWNETVQTMEEGRRFEEALKERAVQELETPTSEAEKQALIEALKNAAVEEMEKKGDVSALPQKF